MNRLLIIGIGSLIMMDDGIGARVAEAIKEKLQENNVTVLIGETDVQYCLDEIRPGDVLVVIDSMMQVKEPGSIEFFSLHDAIKSRGKLHSQHDFSLLDAVSLIYPEIQGYLIGIEAAEIGFGAELSNALGKRFEHICEYVLSVTIKLKEAVEHA